MTIDAVTIALAAVVDGLTGMRDAPSQIPDSVPGYPYAITYPNNGRWASNDASYKTGLHVWHVDIYIGQLPSVGAQVKARCGYIEELPNDLYLAPTLGGACESVLGITWRWIEQAMGAKRELILQFDVEVKYQSANA